MKHAHRILIAVWLGLLASPLWAQEIGKAPEKSGWIADVIAIVLVVCIAVVSFMSSKRGHQD